MFCIAICEDCLRQAEDLRMLIEQYKAERPCFEIRTSIFTSGKELLEDLDAGSVFDLYLLDILMPGLSGIELARRLRERYADVPVVFLTSSVDYALDAFKVSAVQYILKPAAEDALFPVLDKITAARKQEEERIFILRTPERIVKIPLASIICAELAGRLLRINLENGNTLYSRTIRMSFSEAVAPLLKDSRFLHPHKSYILNMALVEELTGDAFIMKNNLRVPVPRYRHAEAKSKYLAYLSGHGVGILGGK